MKNVLTIFKLFLIALASCDRPEVTVNNLIENLEFSNRDKVIDADGTSIVTVTAVLNKDVDKDKRTVKFETSAGAFIDGKDNRISKLAEFEDEKLVAKVQLKAPSIPGNIVIKVEMDVADLRKDYIYVDSIKALESKPSRIKLVASAFSAQILYGSELNLTGTIYNAKDNKASKGYMVKFQDFYEDGTPVGGVYREESLVSDVNSQVRAVYTSGNAIPNKRIYIRATIQDPEYNSIKDSVFIYVLPKNQ